MFDERANNVCKYDDTVFYKKLFHDNNVMKNLKREIPRA